LFLYGRFSQPPTDFWEWFEPYIDDPEEVDGKAGGGQIMTIGEIVRHLITRQDWFSTLFPRIPVPIQIQIDKKLAALKLATSVDPTPRPLVQQQGFPSAPETEPER
jgi:pre-mRNA-splicing factor 38B